MCGRFVQVEGLWVYIEELSPQLPLFSGYDGSPLGRYNIAPTSNVHVLRSLEDGIRVDPVKWGWAPLWAKGTRPDPINARVETVATGKFFRQLWPSGRALVPSEGWYEWLKSPDNPRKKQPYFFRLKNRKPLFLERLPRCTRALSRMSKMVSSLSRPPATRAWQKSMTGDHWYSLLM